MRMRRQALRHAVPIAAAVCCLLLLAGLLDAVLAQGSPFGVGRAGSAVPPPAAAAPGVVGWLLAKQAEFYRGLSALIRAAKADGSAVWGLLGLSFLYGIFHAAGPGHGKAVISSYLVANDESWRRGIVLSFASAFLQALAAVTLVAIAAVLFRATSGTMCNAERVIEIASYSLIALVGARLLWVKARAFQAALREGYGARAASPLGAAVTPKSQDLHHHDHPAHAQHGHVHDAHCGHSHGPEPQMLAGRGGWQRGLSAIFAVGLRPCSGAILVLVFALAQGLFWAGIASAFVMGLGTALTVAAIATLTVGAKTLAARLASARGGGGVLAMRGVEVLAAVVVIAFGLLLLGGYIVAERTACL
jgi:ABC-type nickel/cobalt efflux system permease component RcnA